jgi:hypothetical protein
VSVIILLVNRRNDSSVILAVVRSAFTQSTIYFFAVHFNISHSSGLHIRCSNRIYAVYMRVTRQVDRNVFFKLGNTGWRDGIVNSWHFTVNCCN